MSKQQDASLPHLPWRALMDEQPRHYQHLLALLWLPAALVLVVPVVILLGMSLYVRATVTALASLVGAVPRLADPSREKENAFLPPPTEKKASCNRSLH